jgi:hypothetical protein
MGKIAAFYSAAEVNKPLGKQVHHINDACTPGRDIAWDDRRVGTAEYRLCAVCARLTRVQVARAA